MSQRFFVVLATFRKGQYLRFQVYRVLSHTLIRSSQACNCRTVSTFYWRLHC